MEAFSDGVFAFAMTLLVLGLRDPTIGSTGSLLQGLFGEWPAFLAFGISFTTILVMWMNHHRRILHDSQRTATLGHDTDSLHNIPSRGPHPILGLGNSRRSLLRNIPLRGSGLESALAICNQTSRSAGEQCYRGRDRNDHASIHFRTSALRRRVHSGVFQRHRESRHHPGRTGDLRVLRGHYDHREKRRRKCSGLIVV
ncbi:DUF1211 domain-containing protein [Candidatus Bathyarchaeota archaeon]|nr:MAG: DUF1211 domain-containing protein [Candidatus Bathyarchaeota archaeon]